MEEYLFPCPIPNHKTLQRKETEVGEQGKTVEQATKLVQQTLPKVYKN